LNKGSLRFVMCIRATGDGHVSSIVFRSGALDRHNTFLFDPISDFVETPDIQLDPVYKRNIFQRKLNEMEAGNEVTVYVLNQMPEDFTYNELIEKSGYSSIHYQVELGENSDAPSGLEDLQFEFQLRTILEEAWGEIDHKYRYMRSRNGAALPEYIHTGFYNLSAYLQVAALQAEYLCRLAEAHSLKKTAQVIGKPATPFINKPGLIDIDENEACQKLLAPTTAMYLEETLGFKVTVRTLTYIERRLDEVGFAEKQYEILQKVFTEDRILEFKTIFRETLNLIPFTNVKERNIDVINFLNFAIFDELQGNRVAQEGLRSVLRWRKERLKC
jgi:putative GTP pyrophosphokinase